MFDIVGALRRCFAASSDSAVAELVNGPHRGYFLAVYSLPVVDGFVAYAKVFARRPVNPWEGIAVAKYAAYGVRSAAALIKAQARAVDAIRGWHVGAQPAIVRSARPKSDG